MLASSLAVTIYLPLLHLLANHFRVPLQAINLTIPLYMEFKAISPVIFATASNPFGRPIVFMMYTLYTAASRGLALNRHIYVALLLSRALEGLSPSIWIAISFGVAAVLSPPAERGSILGLSTGSRLFGHLRSRGSWYSLATYMCALTGYGWSVQVNAHKCVPTYSCLPFYAQTFNK